MLGLAMGTFPGRQVARNQKTARRKNPNNEAYIDCEHWEQCLRGIRRALRLARAGPLTDFIHNKAYARAPRGEREPIF